MEKLSLLVPCYQAESHLPRLFESIGAQTESFDEIVLYDDGSTDATRKVASSFGVKVISSDENHGPSFARNQLAKAAVYPWIHFHDADDLMHPEFVAKMKAKVRHGIDAIACQADWMNESAGTIEVALRYDRSLCGDDTVRYLLSHPMSGLNVCYRKERFNEVSGFNEELRCWEDSDLNIRLAAAGARFELIDEVLVTALRHSGGVSYDQKHCWACRLQALESYAKTFGVEYHSTVALEAEKTARNLVQLGDSKAALSAVKLCKELGLNPPISNNW